MMFALEFLLTCLAAAVGIVIIAAFYNARFKSRPVVRTILTSQNDPGIIGDGAWLSKQIKRPRSARVRDIEPRGA